MEAVLARVKRVLPPVKPGEEALLKRLTRQRTGTLAVLAVTVWIAMAEVDRLIVDAATESGRSGSASALQDLGVLSGYGNWGIWHALDPGIRSQVGVLLTTYTSLDVVFAGLYLTLLCGVFLPHKVAGAAIGGVALGELLEVGTQIVGISSLSEPEPANLLYLAATGTFLKWAGLACLAVAVFVYRPLRRKLWPGVVRTWRALFFHRLALAAVVLIAALALLPIAGVNDQMPDTQRAWLNQGLGPVVVTSLAAILVSGGLFYLGRRRSELAWALYVGDPDVPVKLPRYWMWAVPPLLLGIAMVAVQLRSGLRIPLYWQTGLAMGLPVALVAASLLIWRFRGKLTPSPSTPAPPGRLNVTPAKPASQRQLKVIPPRPASRQRAIDTWRCGDVLAILFLAVTGMALVRSFAAPLALGLAGSLNWDGDQQRKAVGYFLFGILIVASAFGIGAGLCRLLWGRFLDPREPAGEAMKWVSLTVAALFAALVFWFAFLPAGASAFAGVAGTAVLTVGAWAMVIGLGIVALQRQRPLPVFEVMGLRAVPVMTLTAILLAAGSFNGGNPAVHQIRELPGASTEAGALVRPDIQTAFEDWFGRSALCGRDVADGARTNTGQDAGTLPPRVRPLLLVAAEGGGIRAAAWTVRAFAELAKDEQCGSDAVLASSGVSGGSVGLTLSRLYGPAGAVTEMEKLAGPETLAAAVSGAVVGDVIAVGTGLMIPAPVPAVAGGNVPLTWHDRAGLMEALSEAIAPELAKPFENIIQGPTGALLLNSTDAGSNCRVVISQLDLPGAIPQAPPPGTTSGVHCTEAAGFPLSVDLLDQQASCPLMLRWSTAAMLSARFPIISPAGRISAVPDTVSDGVEKVPDCRSASDFQLIDGGYSEGSGLGTVSDLWPALQKEVLAHNSCVVDAIKVRENPSTTADPSCTKIKATDDFVAPVFVFLQNSPGADLMPRAAKAAGELAVPLVGMSARKLQSEKTSWIQRLEENTNVCPVPARAATDPVATNPCAEATGSVLKALGGRSVVEVSPNSVPALTAPLGWSLSQLSQDQLKEAMVAETRVKPESGQQQPFSLLLDYLRK